MRPRDLGDRRGQHGDVIGGGVGAVTAAPQCGGQHFCGVVTPHPDRVKPERAFERWPGPFLVRMSHHDGGIHIEHHHLAQVCVGDRRGRQTTRQQRPDAAAYPRPGLGDPAQPGCGQPGQGAPHRRRRGHRTQQRCLVTQHVDVGDRLTTIGDHDRHIGQHPTPVMARRERPLRQRHRQRRYQADPIGQKPQASTTGMSHHAGTTASYCQPSRPQSTVHLRSAFPLEKLETSQSQESPAGQALPCIYTPTNSINDERAGLKAAQRNQSRPPFH